MLITPGPHGELGTPGDTLIRRVRYNRCFTTRLFTYVGLITMLRHSINYFIHVREVNWLLLLSITFIGYYYFQFLLSITFKPMKVIESN